MTDVVFVYPYFNEERDTGVFRYPPLGSGYLAAQLRLIGYSVGIVDCTFLNPSQAIQQIRALQPRILGIYSMVTINHHAIHFAQIFKNEVEYLIAGGPLPSLDPDAFVDLFDVVVIGEGEQTVTELVNCFFKQASWRDVQGIAYRSEQGNVVHTSPRLKIQNLDEIPFPARDLFLNDRYKKYWLTYHGFTATSIMSTRGCLFRCDFCSNPVFGVSYRERSTRNVIDEMLRVNDLGYKRIFFQDDSFTLNPKRTIEICNTLIKENCHLEWMCLSRVDNLSRDLAQLMYRAGCRRVFFGIEAGNDKMLKIINKKIDLNGARRAIVAAKSAGIEAGAFFILGYPGETNSTLLETLHFSSHLPLDYLAYSFPYPIPGTGLYEKVKDRLTVLEWRKDSNSKGGHKLIFNSGFSARKLHFAEFKGNAQHRLYAGGSTSQVFARIFEKVTDKMLNILK